MKNIKAEERKNKVDYGIITIKPEEYRAVLRRFVPEAQILGKYRRYGESLFRGKNGSLYRVATMKCTEQAEGEAQAATQAMIHDLNPAWIIVTGIAGGVPDDAFTLGDVVIGNRVVDLTLNALNSGGDVELGLAGGPMHPEVQGMIANLEAIATALGDWNSEESIGVARPGVSLEPQNFVAQDADWRKKVASSLNRHFFQQKRNISRFADCVIGSSDSLIKDEERLKLFLRSARQIKAVEMELAGVYRAAHDSAIPAFTIRGISDIVGFKRSEDWTEYACEVAASLLLALLRTEPKPPLRTWQDEIKYEKPIHAFHSYFDEAVYIDPWEEGPEDEVAFKKALRSMYPQIEEMYREEKLEEIIAAGRILDSYGYCRTTHPNWQDKPLFLQFIHTVQNLRFRAHIQLLRGDDLESYLQHCSAAYLLLDDIISIPPFSMNGPSSTELPPEDAANANLNYRDVLVNAEKLMATMPLERLKTLAGIKGLGTKMQEIEDPRQKVAMRQLQIWEALNNAAVQD